MPNHPPGAGTDALELAAGMEQEIHLLITDVIMPHMLGSRNRRWRRFRSSGEYSQ